MINLRTYELEHIPEPHQVHIAHFKDVKNASFLQEQLLAGNQDFEYAFVDAGAIVSTAHILAAVHQAVHKLLVSQKLRTRNVHSEIVFSLSPNNNITESFRRFGISPSTTSLLCIKVSTSKTPISSDVVCEHLLEVVDATQTDFSDRILSQGTDWSKVRKFYKIAPREGGGRGQKLIQEVTQNLELEIIGKLVLRSVG